MSGCGDTKYEGGTIYVRQEGPAVRFGIDLPHADISAPLTPEHALEFARKLRKAALEAKRFARLTTGPVPRKPK
jgi:hypothetical protein